MRAAGLLLALGLAALLLWLILAGPGESGEDLLESDTPGSAPADAVLHGRAAPPLTAAKTAAPRVGPVAVHGIVEDEAGAPLSGITVHLEQAEEEEFLDDHPGVWATAERVGRPEPYRPVDRTRTGADGRFSFLGLAATRPAYQVRAVGVPPRFSAARHARAYATHSFVRLVLGRGTAVQLRVVDARGRGLDAFLSGYSERAGREWVPCSFRGLRTDDGGRATVYLADGSYTCWVHVPGVGVRSGVLFEMPQSAEVVIALGFAGGATVAGRVQDTAGKPVAGARVVASTDEPGGGSLTRFKVADADGRYRVEGLRPGTLRELVVAATGFVTVENAANQQLLPAGVEQRVDVTLVRGGVLAGRVTGPDGEGIAGALVEARAEHPRERTASSDRAVTNAAGRYRMTQVPLGSGHVLASAPGLFQPSQAAGWYVIEKESARTSVDIRLARGIPVTGTVVDDGGRLVPRALVQAQGSPARGWWRGDWHETRVETDEQGRFAYPGLPPAPTWKLTAKTADALSETLDVALEPGGPTPAPVALVVRRAGVVEGQVTGADGAVPRGLRVRVQSERWRSPAAPVLGDGTFRVEGLRPGAYEAVAVDWQLTAVSAPVSVTLTWGQVVSGVTLTARAGSTISGVVVDERGDPVQSLRLSLDVSTPNHGRSLSAHTGSTGRFVFTGVPETEGGFPISIENERQPGMYEAGRSDIRLVHAAPEFVHIEGTVHLPDGTPAAGGRVIVRQTGPAQAGQAPPTDARGLSIYAGAFGQRVRRRWPDGRFDVIVQEVSDVTGKAISVLPSELKDVEPGAKLEFRLSAGLQIRGVVVDADDAPVSGVAVAVAPVGARRDPHAKRMRTRPDGAFQFGSLAAGRYEITVSGVPTPWIAPSVATVEAGDEEVRVALVRGGAVRGIVRAPDGAALPGATVTWDGQAGAKARAITDAEGRFELSPVPPGIALFILAAPPRDAPEPMLSARAEGIRAGATDVELRLRAGAYIRGEVVGPAGEAVEGAWLMCNRTPPNAAGVHSAQLRGGKRFQLGPLEPGTYSLRVMAGGRYVSPDPLEVRAPAQDVKVVVPLGLTISGSLQGTEHPERYVVEFTYQTPAGPAGISGGITAAGRFLVTLKEDLVGTLVFREIRGGDRYALVDGVRPSTAPLTVELKDGARIAGRIDGYAEGDDAHVYAQARAGFYIYAQVDKEGTFRFRGVPPGTYTVLGIAGRQPLAPLPDVSAGAKGLILRKP